MLIPTALENGELDGFQVGRHHDAIERRARAEAAEVEALGRRLYERLKARRRRARDPIAACGKLQRWRDRNRERVQAWDRARRAKRRVRVEVRCGRCNRTFHAKRRNARFCAIACRVAFWNAVLVGDRSDRGGRVLNLAAQVTLAVGRRDGVALGDVVRAIPGAKYASVATTMSRMVREGELVREGAGRAGRYRLPSTPAAWAGDAYPRRA